MKKIELSNEEILVLRKLHKSTKDKVICYKINAIILLAQGFSCQEVEDVLLLDERTIRRYEDKFLAEGKEILLKVNYVGKKPKLTQEQLDKLAEFMESHLCSNAKEIVNYVSNEFNISYTVNGIVPLLHKLGFS